MSGFASLTELKSYLNLKRVGTDLDGELQTYLDAAVPVVEYYTGPIASRVVEENHTGGSTTITLRQLPIVAIASVIEYRPGQARTLTAVADPSVAVANSYSLDADTGVITRRNASGEYPFPDGSEAVAVTYTAGYVAVPSNVKLASLFCAGRLYQTTQLGGRPTLSSAAAEDQGGLNDYAFQTRLQQLLVPNQRLPGIG